MRVHRETDGTTGKIRPSETGRPRRGSKRWFGGVSVFRVIPVVGVLLAALLARPEALAQEGTGTADFRPASIDPPKEIPAGSVPQFILVTFDDGITSFAESFIQPVVGGLRNPDSSLVPVTYFMTRANTDPALARTRYLEGNELANHTSTHNTGDGTTYAQWLWELGDVNRMFVNEMGIPADQITGFRAPYLLTNSDLWRVQQELGFTYDASLSEQMTVPRKVSQGVDAYVWPYTMDSGAKTACIAASCPDTALPGLWSIPLWMFYDSAGNSLGAMDPAVFSAEVFRQSLEYMFSHRYNGNRCPLGLYMHAGQLALPERREVLRQFLEEKLKLPDVWMITMRGLIEWLRAPVANAGLPEWFRTGRARGSGRVDPAPPRAVMLLSPDDGAHAGQGRALLSWDVLLTAATYQLQLSTDPGFGTTVLDTSNLVKTTFSLLRAPVVGTLYWRVRGQNTKGSGAWSAVRSFLAEEATAVGESTTGRPAELELTQNYPNPFNPTTLITFTWPTAGRARLAIYDLLGREVTLLVDDLMPAGRYERVWNASAMPSGTYICRLQGEGVPGTRTRKLLLVR